jgi:hypothetical protein
VSSCGVNRRRYATRKDEIAKEMMVDNGHKEVGSSPRPAISIRKKPEES